MQLEGLSQFGALVILLGVMVLGEVTARVSKGKVPGALVISVLLIGGFWTILPKDIAARAGINDLVYSMSAILIVTNLATLISRQEMAVQWRTVLINLMGLGAIVLVTLTLGAALFGWQNAVAATPPLTGGAIATAMTQHAAAGKGLNMAALVAVVSFMMQGLLGYPLTSIFLSREAKRLNTLYTAGQLALDGPSASSAAGAESQSIFTKIKSPSYILFKLLLVGLAAFWLEKGIGAVSGGKVYISRYVWCLLLGFAACEVKFLEKDALGQAKSDGILMNLLLLFLFGSLSTATPDIFLPVAGITICLVLIAAAAMALMALIASKIFKKNTFGMCYCIILTAFYGFPINVMLTREAVQGATEDPKAQAAISGYILPKMLVGGFTSVTIVSVLVAGILINFL
ncbi:membrane protein [Spirochaetia bacterium]|nr:membrane protein [Spirochaetia bacterium]